MLIDRKRELLTQNHERPISRSLMHHAVITGLIRIAAPEGVMLRELLDTVTPFELPQLPLRPR